MSSYGISHLLHVRVEVVRRATNEVQQALHVLRLLGDDRHLEAEANDLDRHVLRVLPDDPGVALRVLWARATAEAASTAERPGARRLLHVRETRRLIDSLLREVLENQVDALAGRGRGGFGLLVQADLLGDALE